MPRTLIYKLTGLLLSVAASLAGLPAQDTTPPLPPLLTLVSVEPATGFSNLAWQPSSSPDLAGYVIYRYLDNQGQAIDTIHDPAAVSYRYTKTFAANYSVEYVVAAIDSSDNVSPLSNPLATIFLSLSTDTCAHAINLNWSAYTGTPLAVEEYSVWYSVNGTPRTLLATLQSAATSYSYTEFENGSSYCFTVEASISGGAISSSNRRCTTPDVQRPPDWINGDFAEVISPSSAQLSFTFDPLSEVHTFRIEKSSSPGGPWSTLLTLTNSSGSFSAEVPFTNTAPQLFRAVAINSCGSPAGASNPLTAQRIKAVVDDEYIIIAWDHYLSFNGTLEGYRLVRIDNGAETEFGLLPPADSAAADRLSDFIYTLAGDQVCYRVEAIESNNPYTSNATAISETICIDTPSGIFVPNAFTPDRNSVNDTFRPVLTFTPVRYRLTITSPEGITLFETTDYLAEWDGNTGSSELPPGIYLWFLETETPGGKVIVRRGTVTILFR